MDGSDYHTLLDPALAEAIARKGFTSLTPVQLAVLDPALIGRDLRITSQSGSGKTVALGLVLADLARQRPPAHSGLSAPFVLVVAPTRELAKQVESELAWLYARLGVRVASATGGASPRDERRALAAKPTVVVGTPGRMLDHLKRGAIDASHVGAVVLDEADRMLDMGFREDLEAILAFLPQSHRTHLVSATFPHEVRSLADRVQDNPAHVEGTRLGEPNADIDHLIHLVDPHQRIDAIINLLLAHPDEQTLIFCRTRAEVAETAAELAQAGFGVRALSGDLEQNARDRALAALRAGHIRALVATDVAARGIDVRGVGRVIHVEPPLDADSYTHRSGRTGRAGRKGTSSVLVSLPGLRRVAAVLRAAGVSARFEPIPSAEAIAAAADERVFAELTADDPSAGAALDERASVLAQRLAAADSATRVISRHGRSGWWCLRASAGPRRERGRKRRGGVVETTATPLGPPSGFPGATSMGRTRGAFLPWSVAAVESRAAMWAPFALHRRFPWSRSAAT
jgi:ATP-dependent RNA helicase DeaD